MPELFLYDASEVNREPAKYFKYDNDPAVIGFREALKELNPPVPFLVRGLFGDYEGYRYKGNHGIPNIKNTFHNNGILSLLKRILKK